MILDSATSIELAFAILFATAFLVAASALPLRYSVGLLVLVAPFQLVQEVDITNNIAMTYMVLVGILLSGRSLKLPMLGSMLLVLFGYLLSISQVHPSLYRHHIVALIILGSGFAMFILAYNLALSARDERDVIRLFLACNLLVVLYSTIQLILGPGESARLFGLEALSTEANRGEGDPRLGGPFAGAPGILAQYLAISTLIVIFDALHSVRSRRLWLWSLAAANVALIVATANRGGFITLLVGLVGLLVLYRKELGTVRTLQIGVAGAAILLIASAFVVEFTEFDRMFDRLDRVQETEGGIPSTRAVVWPQAWERFKDVPWFGQGPTWRLPMEHHGRAYPGRVYIDYPHSLYLYLLVTTGVVGALCFLAFFGALGRRLFKGAKSSEFGSSYQKGLVRLGPLILLLFLVDEIRIEFLRPSFSDYQHIVFAIFGAWVGFAQRQLHVRSQAEEMTRNHATKSNGA